MNSLKGWAGVLSRDWVSECRRVLEVRQAVDVSAFVSFPPLETFANYSTGDVNRSQATKSSCRLKSWAFFTFELGQEEAELVAYSSQYPDLCTAIEEKAKVRIV